MASKRIPADLAVVSFDDSVLFRLGSPSISVVSQPIREMGYAAVRLILGMIRKEPMPQKKFIFSPELQVREST